MNVISLFNGMNTGRQALENVGIKVDKYYSSEIKPYAIELTQHHFPDTIQVGDVTRKARGCNDERHMTPTQLTVIRNCYLLWSNKGDVCFSPFGGAGSEGCQALKMERKSINIELKKSYFNLNAYNHKAFETEKNSTLTLF